jgi:hypothetical protein
VGGYWGLLMGPIAEISGRSAISNYLFWKLQMASGLVLCICVFELLC